MPNSQAEAATRPPTARDDYEANSAGAGTRTEGQARPAGTYGNSFDIFWIVKPRKNLGNAPFPSGFRGGPAETP